MNSPILDCLIRNKLYSLCHVIMGPDYSDEKWSDSDQPLHIPMFTDTLLDETDFISALSERLAGLFLIIHRGL